MTLRRSSKVFSCFRSLFVFCFIYLFLFLIQSKSIGQARKRTEEQAARPNNMTEGNRRYSGEKERHETRSFLWPCSITKTFWGRSHNRDLYAVRGTRTAASEVSRPLSSAGFNFRREQAHMIDPCRMRIINQRSHILPRDIVTGFNE